MTLRSLYDSHAGKISDKWSLYLDIYDRFFGPWQQRELTLVEVGVQNGGSLEIWSRYFARARKLVGCDIDPRCGELEYDDPRISVIVGPVNSEPVHRAIVEQAGAIDIFIDDGSHRSDDIIASFCNYFRHVKPGGLYVIEDLHCSYFPKRNGGVDRPDTSMSFLKALADVANFPHWCDQRPLQSVFEPFFAENIRPDPHFLQDVFAVTFADSLCIVEKRSAGYPTGLGGRVIVGGEASVRPDMLERVSKPAV
jgi:SAM-dependent methyltransferase